MQKLAILLVLVIVVAMGSGCATSVPTNSYIPQNYVRLSGKVDMGTFVYAPFVQGNKITKPNQIQNTAIGGLFLSTDVANFVKRGNALELEKSGIVLDPAAPLRLDANIFELKANDLGYSVDWSYTIQYIIINKANNTAVFDKTFSAPIQKSGKFGLPSDYASIVSETVLGGYDMFIRNPEVKRLLEGTAQPESISKPAR